MAFDQHLITKSWNRRIKALRLGFFPPKSVQWLPCWSDSCRRLPIWSQPQQFRAFLKRERVIRRFMYGQASADAGALLTR